MYLFISCSFKEDVASLHKTKQIDGNISDKEVLSVDSEHQHNISSEDLLSKECNKVETLEVNYKLCQHKENVESHPAFEINIQYPEFIKREIINTEKINDLIKASIFKEIALFKNNLIENLKSKNQGKSFLEADLEFALLNDEIISFRWKYFNFTEGTAHPNHWSRSFNVEISPFRELGVENIFDNSSPALRQLSKICFSKLSKSGQTFDDLDMLEDGLKPINENYSNILLLPSYMQIIFNEYQVAPYVAGEQVVSIPYEDVREFIKNDKLLEKFVGEGN